MIARALYLLAIVAVAVFVLAALLALGGTVALAVADWLAPLL